jgi:hypothetical protein
MHKTTEEKSQGGSDLEISEPGKWTTPKTDQSLRPFLDVEISEWTSGGAVVLKIA